MPKPIRDQPCRPAVYFQSSPLSRGASSQPFSAHYESPDVRGTSATSSAMTGRNKRPPERSPSPPKKRTRGPERSASKQERPPNTERATHTASLPPSRTGSRAGLPDIAQIGSASKATNDRENDAFRPRLNTNLAVRRLSSTATRPLDRPDPARRSSQAFSPTHAQSPGGDSGNSTPVQTAPPAPPMMPRGTLNNVPSQPAAQSLFHLVREMRRKKLIVMKAANTPSGDVSSDVASSGQIKTLKSVNQQLLEENSQIRTRLDRLEDLMKQSLDRRGQVTNDSEVLEAVRSRVSSLETASTQHATDLNTLETWKNTVNSLNKSKTTSFTTNPEVSEAIKSFVQEAVGAGDKEVKEALQEELRNMDSSKRLYVDEMVESTKKTTEKKLDNIDKKAEKDRKDAITLMTGFNVLDKQLQDMLMCIGPVQEFSKINKTTLLERVKQHEGTIGQVQQKCQRDHDKILAKQTRMDDDLDELFRKDKATSTKMGAIKDDQFAKFESLSKQLDTLTTNVEAEQATKNKSLSAQSQTLKEIKAAMDAATTTQQLANVKADMLGLRGSVANIQSLSSLVNFIKSRLGDLEKDSEKLTTLESQVAKLSDAIIAVKDGPAQSAIDADLIAKIVGEHLQAQLGSSRSEADMLCAATQPPRQHPEDTVQNIQPDVKALEIPLQELEDRVEDRLEPMELTVHNFANELAVLQQGLPELLKQALNPVRHSVGQDIQQLRADMIAAQQQTSHVPSATQLDSILEDTKSLKAELENFQKSKTYETSLLEREILELKKELALKAEAATFEGMLNNLRGGLRALQDQYNNISTDALHTRMVHWFLQTYPSSPANMVQQVASLQHDVHGLQDLVGQLAWLTSRSQDLNALLTHTPQLQALAYSADSLQRLVQPDSRIDHACKEAEEAMKKVRTVEKTLKDKAEVLQFTETAVKGLQQSMTNFNSPSSPFVRISAFSALQTDIEDLQKLRTETVMRVNVLESASPVLRQDIDRIRTDFVEPNKEALAMYGQLVLTLGQLQEVVRAICQDLPAANGGKPALDIAFTYDLGPKVTGSGRDGPNSSSRR